MTYKLGFYTTCSPFFGSKLAMWRHHDAVFTKLCQEGLEIHVVLPVVGGQTYVDKLYRGNTSVLYPTLRDQKIVFHSDVDSVPELDGLYLDDIHTFQETTVEGKVFTVDFQRRYLDELVGQMITRGKPVIFSDTDGFCTDILEGVKAEMMDLYNKYKDQGIKMISPFQRDLPNFTLVPFEVDPDKFEDIRPASEREFVLKYVGNNYYREHFVPLFDTLSRVGRVSVNGAGWNPLKDQAPNVEWGPKLLMTPEAVARTYNNSLVALTGRSSFNAERGQEIYLYRWKEYLTAGVFIIPENLRSYTSILPEGTATTDDILESTEWFLSALLSVRKDDTKYAQMVKAQRDCAVEFLGVSKWVPVFKQLLEM